MDIQNHYYGHSAVLAAYAGLRGPRHIAGLLQHGWTLVSPLPVHFGDFPNVGSHSSRRRLLVWSHRSRAWDPVAEERSTSPVGSPFLYLERLLAASGWSPSDKGGPVYIPFHGTRLVRIRGDHKKLASHVAEVDGPSTICLHADDILDRELVDAWASAGHRLVTAGARHDPAFLLRIMHLVGSASRVASNRLSTAIVYAAALGKPVRVHGDPLVPGVREETSLDEIWDRWPEFHTDAPADDVCDLARDELGGHALLAPAPLREALGWDRRCNAGPAADYWLGSPLGKAAKVLGLNQRREGSDTGLSDAKPLEWLRHPLSHLPSPLPSGLEAPISPVAPEPVNGPCQS